MRTATMTAMLALAALAVPAVSDVGAQGAEAEAVMVAAGEWAKSRLPGGALRLDPHRTGRSTDRALAARVAQALGAEVATLEATRTCGDVTDPSTCRLASDALLAIGAPSIRGETATVRVYVWYRQDDVHSPVGKATWDVRLRRSGSGWTVDGERLLD